RYPYYPHQAGWIMTHIGILVILAGAVISRNWGVEGQLMLAEGNSSSVLDMSSHQLEVSYPDGVAGELPLHLEALPRREGMKPKVIQLPEGRGSISLIRFLPAGVGKSMYSEHPNGFVAVAVRLEAPMASTDELLWAGSAQTSRWEIPMIGVIKLLQIPTDQPDWNAIPAQPNDLILVATPTMLLLHRQFDGFAKLDTVQIGRMIPLTTGTAALTVIERKDRVIQTVMYEPSKGRGGMPALQFSVTNKAGISSDPVWLAYGEEMVSDVGNARFRMTAQKVDLGFTISLVDFKRTFYPGTNQAASFSSDVLVTDPKMGTFPFHIAMNQPLTHRGWKFFQSSFVEGTPEYSVFSVGYDPGTWTVYIGSIILILGLIGIFFVKPYLKKRFPPPLKQVNS
ncbi:MAG: cytochrome c biogenesis protein ResB, partial [bacterium]|nr:cytochrome c biogenesis protein ResB [bacterium]